MTRVCSCGRRIVKVHGDAALGVAPVASFHRDEQGRTVMGPFPAGSWRHIDNTPACGDPE